ncbi:hecd-1 [Symbiodinium microadriaticum]|nr:hecd-1 [Symbiodinium microadriaticum]
MRKNRLDWRGFFGLYLNVWNCVDWCCIVLAYLLLGSQLKKASLTIELREGLEEYPQTVRSCYQDSQPELCADRHGEELLKQIESVGILAHNCRLLKGIYPAIVILRMLKAFSAQPRLAILTRTLSAAAVDLFHFGLVFLSVFAAFAVMGTAFFGEDELQFSTLDRAASVLFFALMGEVRWTSIDSLGRPVALLFFAAFQFVGLLLMLNMLIAIMMDIYACTKSCATRSEPLWTSVMEVATRNWEAFMRREVPLQKLLKMCEKQRGLDMYESEEIIQVQDLMQWLPGLTSEQAERIFFHALWNYRRQKDEPVGMEEVLQAVADTLADVVALSELLPRADQVENVREGCESRCAQSDGHESFVEMHRDVCMASRTLLALERHRFMIDSCDHGLVPDARRSYAQRLQLDGSSCLMLTGALHAVIETGEALPVWRHKKDRGLKALTEPISLKLRNMASGIACPVLDIHLPKQAPALSVSVEPLVQLTDLANFLTKVTPCIDEAYLKFCHRLIGHRIWDHHTDKAYEVVAFEIFSLGLPIPVHTVRAEDEDANQCWLLANRSYAVLSLSEDVSDLALKVALNQLQAMTRAEEYVATLDRLEHILAGTEATKISEVKPEDRSDADVASEEAKTKVVMLASGNSIQVLELIRAEKTRCAFAADTTDGDTTCEQAVDPAMRVHTVMIAVSDEIPFELFWPMVKDDIVGAVRELCPRGMPGMEEAVQAGVANNGMGPIAQKLTQQEAETLATRVGHVVQTAVVVDQEALQEAQKEKAKSQQNEPLSGLTSRIQFTPKGDKTWIPGTVVGQLGERVSLVDDKGVLYDKLPRARIRLPPGKRDSTGSANGAPIQAVLSQADLVRIREHLRRRQEEWAERHAQNVSANAGANGTGGRTGTAGEEAGVAGSEQRTPTSSRPTSAPAVAALMHRSRASSAPSIDGAVRRGMSILSREGSLSEVDGNSGALDVVQFMEDEGMGDDDFDEEGGPVDDDEDEDLPPLEAHEADGGLAAGRLGASRGSDGENREFGIGEAGSMEEELRMLEQLRAMEQIISEVLDPSDSSRLRRPGGDSAGDDFFSAPMASLRIRMGGSDLRVPVETCQIRRGGGGKGGSEPLRGEFPSFVRSADSANATSTLDHPVVERLGASDLIAAQGGDDPADGDRGVQPPQFSARFCLCSREEPGKDSSNVVESATGALKSFPLPRSWNLLKAMQFLQDQQVLHSRPGADNARMIDHQALVVEPLQKVPLDNWFLGYELVLESVSSPSVDDATEVGGTRSPTARRTPSGEDVALGNGKRRRRTLPVGELTDAVAREMYSDISRRRPDGEVPSIEKMIDQCGGSATVSNAIELLRLIHRNAPSLGPEMGSWVSSKLDRKLRYQLEDPLSVISGTLPVWAVTLPRMCPFLFSLKTRKMLLKYTAFGPSFAVHWTQESKVGSFLKRRATVQTELNAQTDPRKMQELSQELSNIEEHVVRSNFWLGTLQSTLVRLQKGEEFLRQSDVAMGFLAHASKLLEVQFEGETGFGVAVTQSFYVEVAQALQERASNASVPLWVEDDDSSGSQQHLLCRKGLLLKPLTPGPQRDAAVERFRFLGRLMGQALREGFIVPLPLADEFFALVLGEKLGPDSLPRPGNGVAGELLGALADFAEDLKAGEASQKDRGSSPEQIQAWKNAQADRKDFAERFLSPSDRPDMTPTQEPMSLNEYTSLAGVCFLETGLSGAALCPDGDNILVTADNVAAFVEQATHFWFDAGVKDQVDAFRSGLNDVFPFACLQAFARSELREMFCGEDRIDWDEQALLNHIHPTGGLNDKSPAYRFLVAVLLELNQADRPVPAMSSERSLQREAS